MDCPRTQHGQPHVQSLFSTLHRVRSVFTRGKSYLVRHELCMVRGAPGCSGVFRGAPGSPTRNAGSTRIAQDQHGATTDLPGLPRIEKSSRTVRADHSNFKQFKIAGVLFRTMTDHPRLSRISPDPTQIHHRSDSGSAKFQSETLRNSPGGQCDRGFTFTD